MDSFNNNRDSIELQSDFSEEFEPLIATHHEEHSCLHPSQMGFRYLILALNCLSILGGYYSDVSIAVISTDLIREMEIDQAQYGLLFSVYSFPNMIMVLFGGILLDKVGLRIGLMTFLGLVSFGTLITAGAPPS